MASSEIHSGMPALDRAKPLYPSFKRRLSDPIFYLLPAMMWLSLSARYRSLTLPTAANPAMEAGGLWGESKTQGLSLFGPTAQTWIAPYIIATRRSDESPAVQLESIKRQLAEASLSLPLVGKPDRGYQGWGVKLLKTEADIESYIADFPAGERFLLQRFVSYGGEAGIFYVRQPGAERGEIVSLSLNYAPHVMGDGKSTLGELVDADEILRANRAIYRPLHRSRLGTVPAAGEPVILANSRSARLGTVYRNANDQITPELTARIDEIAKDIEGFYFGRFDLRFSSLERLRLGEEFSVLEVNGAGAEMLHIWDGSTRLRDAYGALWWQYRTAFRIGAMNRRRGYKPTGLQAMVRRQRRQERLRKAYPPST